MLEKYDTMNKPHYIFNIDEKGVNTVHEPSDVPSDKNITPQSVTSGRSETFTVIGGGSSLGTYIPSF